MPNSHLPYFGQTSSQETDQFIIDPEKSLFDSMPIAQGQVLKAYSVMGLVIDSGELKLCAKFEVDGTTAIADGSEIPYAILIENMDTTNASDTVGVMVEGVVNQDQLIFGKGHTIDTVKTDLRKMSIHLKRLG